MFGESRSTETPQSRQVKKPYLLIGLQYQLGAFMASFVSSYIPTQASQVTRAADQVSILTSAFPYSATAGTVVFAGSLAGAVAGARSWHLSDGTTGEQISQYQGLDTIPTLFVRDGGAGQVSLANTGSTSLALNTNFKTASAWILNDFALSLDGDTPATDSVGTLPTVTTLKVGSSFLTTEYLNGHIKRLDYYAVRKTDAELQVLSS
jgi:hypothetical protein